MVHFPIGYKYKIMAMDSQRNKPESLALPDHILQLILANLGPDDLTSLACVCHRFNSIASTDFVWESALGRPFFTVLQELSNMKSSAGEEEFDRRISGKSLVGLVWRRSNFFKTFAWKRLNISGSREADSSAMAGMFHSLIYLPHLRGLVQLGGSRFDTNLYRRHRPLDTVATNSVFLLDLETLSWNRPETIGDAPPDFHSPVVVRIRTRLYVVGGCSKEAHEGHRMSHSNTVYVLETDTRPMIWSRLETSGDIPAIAVSRAVHSGHAVGNKIVLVGAWSGDVTCKRWNDVRILDTTTMVWTLVQTQNLGYGDGQDTSCCLDQGIYTVDFISQRLYTLKHGPASAWTWEKDAIKNAESRSGMRSISATVPLGNKMICFDAGLRERHPMVLDIAEKKWIQVDIHGELSPDLLHGYAAVSIHCNIFISGYSRQNPSQPQFWVLRPIKL